MKLANFAPHVLKRAFRAMQVIFATWWADARDQAVEGSLDAATWPDYYRLLRACQDVLDHAPMHPAEARTVHVHRRYERSLERLATMLAGIFPNGFMELESYVYTPEVGEWRRAAGLARYHRIQRRRKRYRRGRGRK